MTTLQQRALARVALTYATVESFYDGSRSGTAEQCLKALCESHERLRAELQGAETLLEENAKRIADLEKALRYAADCSTLEMVRDTMRGMGIEDRDGWRQALRDFAEDREQHTITRQQWECDRHHGITLYASGDFFTAYFDDAAELWNQADDTRPMFHVMVQSDPPHRTCIHAIHLAAWAQHLASICLPLQIMAMSNE